MLEPPTKYPDLDMNQRHVVRYLKELLNKSNIKAQHRVVQLKTLQESLSNLQAKP